MTRSAADICARPWAIHYEHLTSLMAVAKAHETDIVSAVLVDQNPPETTEEPEPYQVIEGVALIEITGVIWEGAPGWATYMGLATDPLDVRAALLQALQDPAVRSIYVYVDSPGGYTDGVDELADAIYEARAEKPIHAHIANLGASAAYEIASQAGTITANRSASVGSIGVYLVLDDWSKMYEDAGVRTIVIRSGKYKGTGVVGASIEDDQLVPLQEMVGGLADQFVATVARGRALAEAQVAELATGRTWLAPVAADLKLIDRVATAEEAFAELIDTGPDRTIQSNEGDAGMGIKDLIKRARGTAAEEEDPEQEEELEEAEETEKGEEDTEVADEQAAESDAVESEDVEAEDENDSGAASEPEGKEAEESEADAGLTITAASELKRYCEAVGEELGVRAIIEGLTIAEAKGLRIAQLEAELAEAQETIRALGGESEPVSTGAPPSPEERKQDELTQAVGERLASFARDLEFADHQKN